MIDCYLIGFHPDQLKVLEDCSFNDVMKVIQYRYSQLSADDIKGLNGLFGRPRIDQAVAVAVAVAVDQLKKLIVSAIPEDVTSALLSYMTVQDGMSYYQCKRGVSELSSQSLFQPQKASGNAAEQVSDMTAPGKEPRP